MFSRKEGKKGVTNRKKGRARETKGRIMIGAKGCEEEKKGDT